MDPYTQQAPAKNRMMIVTAVVVVLLLVAGVLWWFENYRESTNELPSGSTLTTAPEGKVVSGFPMDLILEDDVKLSNSFRMDYAENKVSQPVVSYVSSKGYVENIEAYKAYLSAQGWEVSHEADASTGGTTFFYAKKGDAVVNITLTPKAEGGTSIVVAYAAPQQ
jgi:hypothetical protein